MQAQSAVADELVIVPGHGVVKFWMDDLSSDAAWIGIFSGDAHHLVEHIEAGVKLAAEKPNALLVFSGGETRPAAGPISEGSSYFMAARKAGWYGHPEVEQRAFVEDHARDSFENLLFSVLEFYKQTGRLPKKVYLAGWEFKVPRFVFHAETVGLKGVFEYVRVNMPDESPGNPLSGVLAGEGKVAEQFRQVPFGDSAELVAKKIKRDPFRRGGLRNYAGEMEKLRASGRLRLADGGSEEADGWRPVFVL